MPAAQQRDGSSADAQLRIAITGASGFLGSALVASFRSDHITVQRLTRSKRPESGEIRWDPAGGAIDAEALEGVGVVVNLAGEPLARRWTARRKREIRESRVRGTALLSRTLAELARPPRALISASAIGYYGDRGDEELDEGSAAGTDFLASVAREWEAATDSAVQAGIRVVLLRTGVVLNPAGGALAKMLRPFKLGVAGRIGSGAQWMSWIGRQDWVRAVRFLIDSDKASGPVNLVAPNPVPNSVFVKTLARVLGRPALVPVPATAIGLLFGEMGRATLLSSQRIHPRRLVECGFDFTSPTLEAALRAEGV